MPIVIRQATMGDWPRISRFIAETYDATATFKGSPRWRWQFLDNPYRPEGETAVPVWIALETAASRVIGQIAVQDAIAIIADCAIPASWIVDVMVHPAHRGKGLGHQIHEAVTWDRNTLFTLTMAPATRRIAERAGCITLGPTSQMLRLNKLSASTIKRIISHKTMSRPGYKNVGVALNATKIGPAALAASLNGWAVLRQARTLRSIITAPQDLEISEVSDFSSEIDALWTRVSSRFPAVFERNSRFLNWRFVSPPDLIYRKFILRDATEARGYLIVRSPHACEIPVGIIVDLFADPTDQAALDLLIDHGVQTLADTCEYIEAAASTPAFHAAYERFGFFRFKTMMPTVVCRDEQIAQEIVRVKDNWHFSKADHDWDQIHPVPTV